MSLHFHVLFLATVKSPKSAVLPVVEIVTYSISFTLEASDGLLPPENITLVLLDTEEPVEFVSTVKSPKSAALPK